MGKSEIESALRIGIQYLNPIHNPDQPGGLEAQKDTEEANIGEVVSELTKRDQDVRKIWQVIKRVK